MEILYKTFNLGIFHILRTTILIYLKNSASFLSDFCRNNKQKQTGAEEVSNLFQDFEGTNPSTEKIYLYLI